ncbi:hypothetical protein BpHYR1_035857 [Brachionus plicatilis]|uniref:Uncharacterized protein n=1 Tax=Brachionus plicatilis TaxID=10195 RepID=A0A3M7S5E5_BRAPC|nr:hypothetical protein BpHYR1_035857 [Brachionus plicatilis]
MSIVFSFRFGYILKKKYNFPSKGIKHILQTNKNDPLAKIDKKSLMYELKVITKKETIQEILNQGNQKSEKNEREKN